MALADLVLSEVSYKMLIIAYFLLFIQVTRLKSLRIIFVFNIDGRFDSNLSFRTCFMKPFQIDAQRNDFYFY